MFLPRVWLAKVAAHPVHFDCNLRAQTNAGHADELRETGSGRFGNRDIDGKSEESWTRHWQWLVNSSSVAADGKGQL